jgi:hypothetical protein
MPLLLAILLAAAGQKLAVLDFKSELTAPAEKPLPRYFADQVRGAALAANPALHVITRENLISLLKASKTAIENCEGECEIETGRRIGADLVVSGDLLRIGSSYELDMRLHDTAEGRLLSTATASGHEIDDLDKATPAAVAKLLMPIGASPAAPGPAAATPAAATPAAASPPPAPPPAPRARSYVDGPSGLEFVRLAGGDYTFGCLDGEQNCKPRRKVRVAPFALGKTEVPVSAWMKCAAAGVCSQEPKKRVLGLGACSWTVGLEAHPMNCLSRPEAEAFCRWIGGRLPTEEEWEYAARAGRAVKYPWGDAPWDATRANLKGTEDGFSTTAPVGSFPAGATPDGLLDLAGNVWEIVAGGNEGVEFRGGAWGNEPKDARASYFGHWGSDMIGGYATDIGFRCAQ